MYKRLESILKFNSAVSLLNNFMTGNLIAGALKMIFRLVYLVMYQEQPKYYFVVA